MIIAFIIWSIVAALFWGIGISGRKSKEAVEIIGTPLLFLEQNSPMFVPVILGVVALVIGMMIVYFRIQAKYKA